MGASRENRLSTRTRLAAAAALLFAAGVAGLIIRGQHRAELALAEDLYVDARCSATPAASPDARTTIRALLASPGASAPQAAVTVDYPLDGSVFPPELCSPTFLWHDADSAARLWLIDVRLASGRHVYVLSDGRRAPPEIDPRCVAATNAWEEPPGAASARAWMPDARAWEVIKAHSTSAPAVVNILGADGADGRVVSRGSVRLATSADPVGAPIFYRDVPLMPARTDDGVIQPIVPSALPLIQWRLRDLSKDDAPVVMEHLPTCANCHSFSRGARVVGMDMDGPSGDKGAHFTKDVASRMVVGTSDVFSWNRYTRQASGEQSYGMFPRISPDGRWVVASVHEALFVTNYLQFQFLQTFYPTRGILAVYNRATGEIRPLPGADDPAFVQSNPEWSPDGKSIVFIRASASDPYPNRVRAAFAGDPNETQIRYDLYRVPFNDARGGTAEAVAGASGDGMSHSFPRFSPDGRWLVFVRCANGMLMRPDSRLVIIPAGGGEPREMACNTPLMNSWHSWSPNSRWLVFSSKWQSPFTRMYLTHVDEAGNSTPPVLVPDSTAANRAVNLPEFAEIAPGGLLDITTPAVDYRRELDRAVRLQKEGRLADARDAVLKSLSLKSDYPETYLANGFLLELEGKPEEGLAQYRQALEIDPQFYSAHNNIGAALMRMGRLPEAMEQYQKALAVYPRYDKALVNMGDALNRLGRPKEAAAYFRKALAVDAGNAVAHHNLGVSLLL